MAFASNNRTQTSLADINVTPLVDVVLVLLIIFMVTAPILQTGIDVQLPETRSVKDVNPEQHIVISISKEGLLYLGSEPININLLPERLQRQARSGEPIYLRADGDLKFKSVIYVMDVIRAAGFANINIVTRPLQAEANKGGLK